MDRIYYFKHTQLHVCIDIMMQLTLIPLLSFSKEEKTNLIKRYDAKI